jgi:hypothetical protein
MVYNQGHYRAIVWCYGDSGSYPLSPDIMKCDETSDAV